LVAIVSLIFRLRLDGHALLFSFCSHAVEMIGEAFDAGWRVRVCCGWGPRDGMKRRRECVYGGELDINTLVWTRGATFPLARLETD
jgi:hypothetical protein